MKSNADAVSSVSTSPGNAHRIVHSHHNGLDAPSTQFTRPTFLMCSPEWYEVRYVINPWMAGNVQRSTRDTAFAQWKGLYTALKNIGDVRLLQSLPDSPDMTFVAHGALVNYGLAAVASFTHEERKSEELHLRRWLEDAGFLLWQGKYDIAFEGEGDAMFSPKGDRLWVAQGPRTSALSHQHLAHAWQLEVSSLRLVDPRFFHLDTCFAPLSGDHVLYFPSAFDAQSLQKIESAYPPNHCIAISEAEAVQFGCNVINVGAEVILHAAASSGVANRLRRIGYRVTELPLGEFIKAGGSAKSLALRLSDLAVTHQASLLFSRK